ncbi:MAG TPA: hypothetical protein VKI61_15490, partial [Chitinophagaceae bacterium]|nr:hypothetical protein [Chitinophagaceae bacterium]
MKTPQHEFDMRTLDWFQSNTTRQDRKYTSTYFEIIWVKRGSGLVTTGFATYPVNDDRTFLLLPGQNRKFNIEPGAEGCYISFSRDFLESHSCQPGLASLLEPYVPDNIFPVKYNSAEEQADTAYIFLKLEQEFSGDFLFRSEIINTYLQTLLLSIARKINPDGKSMGQCREVEITRKFMTL